MDKLYKSCVTPVVQQGAVHLTRFYCTFKLTSHTLSAHCALLLTPAPLVCENECEKFKKERRNEQHSTELRWER